MRPSLGSALVTVALVLALGVGATAIAAPPPTQLCATCDSDLEGATDRGTLDVYLEDDGDARWVERIPVDPNAADRYSDDPDRLERDVEESWARYHVAGDDAANVSTTVESGAVVVSYDVSDVAAAGVGDVRIVDYFYAGGTATRYHVGADRLTLHPPDGTTVRTHPAGASLENGALTWEGGDPGRMGSDFDSRTLVTYGPDGISTTAAAHATVAVSLGPQTVHHAAWGGLVPGFVVGAAALATARVKRPGTAESVRHRARRFGVEYLRIDGIEDAIVAAGLAGVAVSLLGIAVGDEVTASNAVALCVASGVYAAVGAAGRRLRDPDTRVLLAVAFVGALGCAAILLGLVRSRAALAPAALVLSAFAFLPFGCALERRAAAWIGASLAVVLAGPFVAMALLSPMYVFGFPPVFHGFVLLPAALLVAAAGYPLAVVGRRLANGRR